MIKTLLDRANTIPFTPTLQAEETENVLHALELNGYNKRFIEEFVNDGVQTNRNQEKEIRG